MKTDFAKMSDRELVARLLRNDHGAWDYVLLTVVMRIVEHRKFSEMLSRTSHPQMEAVTTLCERLYENDFARLRNFRFDCPLDLWLEIEVRRVVQKVTGLTGRKNQGREIPVDHQDANSVFGQVEHPISSVDVHAVVMDKREAFVRFWRKDQENAFILLMKNELRMPMESIGVLLNRPANTIVQKAKRAQARLDKLEQE